MSARIPADALTPAQRAAAGIGPARKGKRQNRNKPHNELVKSVIAYLTARGILCWQNDTTAVYDRVKGTFRKWGNKRKGVSDIIAVVNGAFMAFECKTGRGRLTDDQKAFQADVIRAGGVFVEVRSLADVVKALEAKP